jgi:hypothetical protein
MKALLAQLVRGIPVAALVAAGFTLGTHFLDFPAYVATSGAGVDRSCTLPEAFHSDSTLGGRVDARAFIAFLQTCHP